MPEAKSSNNSLLLRYLRLSANAQLSTLLGPGLYSCAKIAHSSNSLETSYGISTSCGHLVRPTLRRMRIIRRREVMRKYIMISKYFVSTCLGYYCMQNHSWQFNDIVARVFPYLEVNQILVTKVESNQGGI